MGTSGSWSEGLESSQLSFFFEQLQACKFDHNLPSGNVTERYWKPWFMDDWLSILWFSSSLCWNSWLLPASWTPKHNYTSCQASTSQAVLSGNHLQPPMKFTKTTFKPSISSISKSVAKPMTSHDPRPRPPNVLLLDVVDDDWLVDVAVVVSVVLVMHADLMHADLESGMINS